MYKANISHNFFIKCPVSRSRGHMTSQRVAIAPMGADQYKFTWFLFLGKGNHQVTFVKL